MRRPPPQATFLRSICGRGEAASELEEAAMAPQAFTRRQLLERGALAGAVLAAPGALVQSALGATTPLKSYQANLLDYIPPIVPVADGGIVDLAVREVNRVVHPATATMPTRVWSYELASGDPRFSGAAGSWIGPILALDASSAITVNVAHSASITQHLLAGSIDRTVLDPYVSHANTPDTRFMTHLHGAFVDGANDGNPFATHHADEWRPGQVETKVYPAQDRAALIWYHQHAHGITHLNVYAGLAGGYLLRDELDTGRNDNALGLPANVDAAGNPIGLYEVPLVIQDRLFQTNAARTALDLFYPPAPWVPEFFGDTMCVNGAVEPFMEVEPRLYRFRIINGCNARFLNLEWKPGSLTGVRPPMHVIGSDGGLVPKPSTTPSLVIAPGERYDIVVDFSSLAGERVNLGNSRLPKPVVNPAGPLPRIMQFRVTKPLVAANLPAAAFDATGTLTTDTPATALQAPGDAKTRYHTFEEVMGARGPLGAVINGKSFEGRPILDPVPKAGYPFDIDNAVGVEETPRNGDTEDWVFANTTADTHPLHVHLVQFGVIERLPFDVAGYLGALAAARAGQAGAPPLLPNGTIDPMPFVPGEECGTPVSAAEKGWKDTVQMHPGEVTRIRAKFELDDFSPAQDYVFHCHILEHESNSMMRPYRVVA
jgi:FtsP/CotA-like multicopper oxidase with cupredoxin domain